MPALFWKSHSSGREAIYSVSRGPVRLRNCLESPELNQYHTPKHQAIGQLLGFQNSLTLLL